MKIHFRFCTKDNLDKALRQKPKIGKISKSELPDHLSVAPKKNYETYKIYDVCSTNDEEMRTLHSCDLSMSLSDETQTEVLLHVKGTVKGFHNSYIKEDVNMNKYCIEEMEQDGQVVKAKACILKRAETGKS